MNHPFVQLVILGLAIMGIIIAVKLSVAAIPGNNSIVNAIKKGVSIA